MNETCPHCHIRFEREEGYFTMAIFIAYLLGLALMALTIGLMWYWSAPLQAYYWVPTAVLLLASPLIFRYGRVLWLYIDEWLDPHPD
jgi:hypothetical protein